MATSPQFLNPPRRYRSKRPEATLSGRRSPRPPQRGQGQPQTKVVPLQKRSPQASPRPTLRRTTAASGTNPLLLRFILFLQHSSSAIAFALVGAVLLAYASTVYIQQQWSEEYRKLESLQREIRNLTAADAIFKDNLAQQAEQPDTGLVMPSPDNNIYLSPSSPQTPAATPPKSPPKKASASKLPIGY
jgi:hypothetical protein